jgi:hypothetical protein
MRQHKTAAASAVVFAATIGLVIPLALVPAQAAPTQAAYDSIGPTVPGNVVSAAFEAQQTSEFGDLVGLASGGDLTDVTVEMSSWGCESGHWTTTPSPCSTTPGATFSHPLTLTLYKVDRSGPTPTPGDVIVTQTHAFDIPYRPSASPSCGDGRWSDGTNCYNGYATPVTFHFAPGTTLPSEVIWGLAYNTTHYGAAPIGEGAACYSSSGGCGYDSLNVGSQSLAGQPSAGTDENEDVAYVARNGGPLAAETGWTGYRPLARISVEAPLSFDGFFQPVDNNQVNMAKAGQTIPVKWRLTQGGQPVSDPASFESLTSRQVNCATQDDIGLDTIESYTNASGLLYQGDGNWQFNWKTAKNYAGQCRVMTVTLSDGSTHTASFQFK